MPIFELRKLVRDKIPDDQIALGEKPQVRTLTHAEHRRELLRKIIEEAQEQLDADAAHEAQEPQDTDTKSRLGEIPDMKQAYDDLLALEGISAEEVATAQRKKAEKSGTFSKGFYVETLETQEEDPWTRYYRQEPERFPEIG